MSGESKTRALVSVIVPVFNGERYLSESLGSILRQTYSRTEIFVMDDASTDGTREVAAAYGERVKYHRQRANRGIYGNANDGIDEIWPAGTLWPNRRLEDARGGKPDWLAAGFILKARKTGSGKVSQRNPAVG